MSKKTELHSYEVPIPTADGERVAEVVTIMVEVEWDEMVREWLLTPDAELLIEETKARHMGLLTPAEIRSLREKLGLSQAELSELIKIGAKTWTRWETGRQRPSQSLNLLLRGLQVGLLTPQSLRQLNAPPKDWTEATAAKTAMPEDLSLALPITSEAEWYEPGVYEEDPLAA
jgi:DNA-binding transcriptional regulator YiaG